MNIGSAITEAMREQRTQDLRPKPSRPDPGIYYREPAFMAFYPLALAAAFGLGAFVLVLLVVR